MKHVTPMLLSLLIALPLAAQSVVPVEREPRHHLKFENKYTRVFDVVVPPGDATLFHTHSKGYVFVSIGDADLKAQLSGSPVVDLPLKNGEVRFSKSPVTHRVLNQGKMDFRNITIEVLTSPESTGGGSLDQLAGHTLLLENERVRVWQLVLEPGQSTVLHKHARPGLGVAISGGQLMIGGADGRSQNVRLKPGDFQWHEAGTTHTLKNVGKDRFEAVDIEWR